MRYKRLGQTDIEVSVICQGCWSIVTQDTTWGTQDVRDSIETIQASLDAGVNFFDTAEGYGRGESEQILGKALGSHRKDAVVASKVGRRNLEPATLKQCCEASLQNLGTDYIDLYQVHWPNLEVPLADTLGAMAELQQAGKVRAVGVSNFGVSYLSDALQIGRVESNQLAYNLLWRPIEYEVQPLCAEHDVGILTYSSLAQGLLTGKFASADEVPEGRARTRLFSPDRPHCRHEEKGCEAEVFAALGEIRRIADSQGLPMGRVALAWLLAQPGVTSAIVGGRTADQATENAKATEVQLPPDVLAALADATEPVKVRLGANADMWQTDSRMERPQRRAAADG